MIKFTISGIVLLNRSMPSGTLQEYNITQERIEKIREAIEINRNTTPVIIGIPNKDILQEQKELINTLATNSSKIQEELDRDYVEEALQEMKKVNLVPIKIEKDIIKIEYALDTTIKETLLFEEPSIDKPNTLDALAFVYTLCTDNEILDTITDMEDYTRRKLLDFDSKLDKYFRSIIINYANKEII